MLKRIQGIIQVVRIIVQRSLMMVSLVFLYVVGFGLTALFLRLLKPAFLSRKFMVDATSWSDAPGYDPDDDDNVRQS